MMIQNKLIFIYSKQRNKKEKESHYIPEIQLVSFFFFDIPTPPRRARPSGSISFKTSYTKSRGTFKECISLTFWVIAL